VLSRPQGVQLPQPMHLHRALDAKIYTAAVNRLAVWRVIGGRHFSCGVRALRGLNFMAVMQKTAIQMPEKGTYQWQLFNYWSDEYRQTRADHSAYIALNFAGALDVCRAKVQTLLQHHHQHASDAAQGPRHHKAIARLQNTLSGAALAYESSFQRH